MTSQAIATRDKSPVLPDLYRAANWAALDVTVKDEHKDRRSRLTAFDLWLADDVDRVWHAPDLKAYRDELALTRTGSTISAHLSTIRARYKELCRDRDRFYALAVAELVRLGQDDTPANRKALVDEIITRIKNAIDPATAPVKAVVKQDEKAGDQVRLTRGQASKLIATPGLKTTKSIRDTALLALALSTGLREIELVRLDVCDLRQYTLDGQLALEVRKGKGSKQRLVLYGELDTCLVFLDAWLERAGITDGAVFKPIRRGGHVQDGRLTTRSIRKILEGHPVTINGKLAKVEPHDLRRSYAALCYDNGRGQDVVAIQQNLGHANLATTLRYIGILSSEARKPGAVIDFPLDELGKLEVQARIEV